LASTQARLPLHGGALVRARAIEERRSRRTRANTCSTISFRAAILRVRAALYFRPAGSAMAAVTA